MLKWCQSRAMSHWFYCLQSLQQKNLELLTVVRTLGAEKENEKAAVQAAREEEKNHVKEELSAIQAENARVQVGHHSLNRPAVPSIFSQSLTHRLRDMCM